MRTIFLSSVVWRLTLAAIYVLIAVPSASPMFAQETTCKIRTVIANVSGPDGKLIRGLSAADFQAKLRGKPVAIRLATVNEQGRQILILLNMYGSMRMFYGNSGVLDIPMVRSLIRHDSANSRFALATFSYDFQTVVPFTNDPQRIANRISTLKLDTPQPGDPRLSKLVPRRTFWEVILDAVQVFQPPNQGDVIYAVTNGAGSREQTSLAQARESLLDKGVRLFALIVADTDAPPLFVEGPREVEAVARQTGGDSINSKVGALFAGNSKPSRADLETF